MPSFVLVVVLFVATAWSYHHWIFGGRVSPPGDWLCSLFGAVFGTLLLSSVLAFVTEGRDQLRRVATSFGIALGLFVLSHGFLGLLFSLSAHVRGTGDPSKLGEAASSGDAAEVKRLLDAGADPNGRDAFGNPPLVTARDVAVVRVLLENGADPNRRYHENGETALMQAARYGEDDVVALLIAAKADLELRNETRGETALEIGIQARRDGVVRLLREAGAKDDTVTEANGRPLPPDGGEPFAACRAYLAAIQRWDVAALGALRPRGVSFEEKDARAWKDGRPAEGSLVGGFASEDAATLTLEGSTRAGKERWSYQLAKENGRWIIRREWSVTDDRPG